MPKISLWHANKGLDYQFADRVAGENLQMGGVGILLHKYIGVEGEEPDVTAVQDFLFLENRKNPNFVPKAKLIIKAGNSKRP